ncbi:hypothetical protein GYA49_04550 [Candidatus Beckwithbacteria bacterium]|nr:hypothetical protein [Candidatus Beckwithbacteria bacterium]
MVKKGYFNKSPNSNKKLIKLFEKVQKKRYVFDLKKQKNLIKKLYQEEVEIKDLVLKMLKKGELKTADDYFRAGHFFHHGSNYNDYALAVTLYSIGSVLGDDWCKNYMALAIDRFLLSISRPQLFVTQFELKKDKWVISNYENIIPDSLRKKFDISPLKETFKTVKKLNKP